MLRWILIGAAALVGIIVIFVIVTWSNLDSIIETAVEKYGSDVTRVQVSLDEASIDPVSGEGALSGLTVGNPAGFETDNAFSLGQIKVGLDTSSLTEDTIVIREIVITRPQVTYEYGTDGSNVAAIQSNVDAFMAQQSGGESAGGEGPKVIVENIYIRGGEVKVSATIFEGKTFDTSIPDIHLADIGKGGGATPGELVDKMISAIGDAASAAVADLDLDLDSAVGAVKDTASDVVDSVSDTADDATDMVKEKAGDFGDAIGDMIGN